MKSIIYTIIITLFFITKGISQDKPNVVIVFMDNFGWGEPGFNGGGITRGAPTPRMDKLADEGLRFTNFNVEVQCTPSRSALMTGRYAIRSGNATVPLGEGVYGLVDWEITIAEMLSDNGYTTGMFGKWHLGRTKGRFPTDQGFDEWYGVPNSTDESTYSSLEGFGQSGLNESHVMSATKGSTPEKIRPYRLDYRPLIDRDLTDKAMDFMERSVDDKKPFFLYLPYTATHFPTMAHPDFKGKSGNGEWADLLMQIDSYLGELQNKIKELGIEENTIFVFTADNGPEALNYGSTSITVEGAYQGSAGPWRGTLFTGFEGALRVPFVIKWPKNIPEGTSSDEIAHAMDLFPTIAAITKSELPQDRVIDGIDMSDFFLGKSEKSGRDGFIVYMGKDIFGVKWKNWKLHFEEQEAWNTIKHSYTMPRVYNLYDDPQENAECLYTEDDILLFTEISKRLGNLISIKLANEALESGAAKNKLEEYIEFSNTV